MFAAVAAGRVGDHELRRHALARGPGGGSRGRGIPAAAQGWNADGASGRAAQAGAAARGSRAGTRQATTNMAGHFMNNFEVTP